MQIAVFSDVHGNLEAFEAVLDDIARHAPYVAHIFSLGDVVGYGPDPDICSRIVQEKGILSVLGNHELGVIRSKYRKWFNSQSREALKRTCELVSDEMVEWMKTLPLFRVEGDCFFVHGLPPDSALKYLYELSVEELPQVIASVNQPVIFVGHTHDLELVSWDGGLRHENECIGLDDGEGRSIAKEGVGKESDTELVNTNDTKQQTLSECIGVTRRPLVQGQVQLDKRFRYLVNVGAVGQPRDGDPRAKYVLWDTETWELTVRFVSYDVEKTIAKFATAGMPERYALRLR